MFNLNRIIVIVFNCTCAYAWGYTLVECKNQRAQIQLDSKLESNFVPCVHIYIYIYFFFFLVAYELFDAKTEESKSI